MEKKLQKNTLESRRKRWDDKCTPISLKYNPKTNKNFAKLCSVIINRGVRAKDKSFLDSDWCELLESYVELYSKTKNPDYEVVI